MSLGIKKPTLLAPLFFLLMIFMIGCSGEGRIIHPNTLTSSCEIILPELDLIEAEIIYNDCNLFGIMVFPSKLYANDDLTLFEIKGWFYTEGRNDFYLKGNSEPEIDSCMHGMSDEGFFALPISFTYCSTRIKLAVVAVTEPDSEQFCSMVLQVDQTCVE